MACCCRCQVVQVDNDIEFGFTRPLSGTNLVVDEVDITARYVLHIYAVLGNDTSNHHLQQANFAATNCAQSLHVGCWVCMYQWNICTSAVLIVTKWTEH